MTNSTLEQARKYNTLTYSDLKVGDRVAVCFNAETRGNPSTVVGVTKKYVTVVTDGIEDEMKFDINTYDSKSARALGMKTILFLKSIEASNEGWAQYYKQRDDRVREAGKIRDLLLANIEEVWY